MNPAIAARIPLVCRNKPPGLSLDARIAELTALTFEPPDADHHQLVARASGVLNFAALIASDTGLPDLAADLCWRHHDRFFAERLDQDNAVMALMPLVNIARLLIREGQGAAGYDLLHRLYQAARGRTATIIAGRTIDLAQLVRTDDDHRRICTELWVTLLIDGARALARAGHWTAAASAMAQHRGIGTRLLDGRQIQIMALLEQHRRDEAAALIDTSSPTESWEHLVATILHRQAGSSPPTHQALDSALDLIARTEPLTTASRVSLCLAALDSAGPTPGTGPLSNALAAAAATDAYAARDVLAHTHARTRLSPDQRRTLGDVVAAAGLGARSFSPRQESAIGNAVDTAAERLTELLRHAA